MGYQTEFSGRFDFSRELSRKEEQILNDFSNQRHVEHGTPGHYCQWTPTKDGMGLAWDGGEKFYDYTEWLEYLIEHFFKPWGIVVNGEVEWHGEDRGDIGLLVCKDNVVTAKRGRIVYE